MLMSKSLPGVGVTGAGVTNGWLITTSGAGVATGCAVIVADIVIIIACKLVIIVPSGPITGADNNESPVKANSAVPASKKK